jgi:monoamine oxidase
MKTSFKELESPYLEGKLEFVAPAMELSNDLAHEIGENPFVNSTPAGDSLDELSTGEVFETQFEQEVIGADERTLVANALAVPNRWVCAIDLLIADPKLGRGVPLIMRDSRGTGILIGPRHVLTAKHVLAPVKVRVDNQDVEAPITSVRVSPARHGDNTSHPLGKASSKAIYRSKPYLIKQRKTLPDGRVIDLPITWDDDLALIILDQDLSGRTHTRMKGPLGYWGQTLSQAAVRRLDPAKVQGREVTVIGYPGDRCGKDVITGSSADKERLINRCIRNRRDEWASTQWRSQGKVNMDPTTSRIEHTADTYKGESGGPICLRNGDVLDLLGVHVDQKPPGRGQPVTSNLGVRVTRHVLREICSWMNADAGYQIATIKDDTLIVQPRTKEARETLEIDTAEILTDLEDAEGFEADESNSFADEEEHFRVSDELSDECGQEAEESYEFADERDEEDFSGEADADLPVDEITEFDVEDAEESGTGDERLFEALEPNCLERLKSTHVAVVGGGLAGLMAARRLGHHGIKSTVFEARSQLGGRVLSNYTFSSGRITEEGAELIGSFHTTWLELAWEYGLAVISRMDESLYERTYMDVKVTLDRPLRMDENIALNKQMTFQVLRPMAELASQIKHPSRPWLEPPKIKQYDGWSVARALEELYKVDPKSQLWKMIELRFVNTEVAPLKEMNFLGLLCKVKAAQIVRFKSDGPDNPKGPENTDAHLMRYWNELEIFRCADGCQKLAEEIANGIKHTAKILKSRAVTNIELSKKGVVLMHKQVIDERKGTLVKGAPRSERFDYVILAIPPSVWKGVTITVDGKDAKLDVKPGLVKMGDAVKYFSDLKERFWIKKKAAPLGGSLTLGQIWEGTDNQTRLVKGKGSPPLKENQGIVLSVFAGPILAGPRAPTKADCHKELKRLFPEYTDNFNKDIFTDWPNIPFIKTGYAAPKIGEFLKIGEELSKPFHDVLFFAGEHTQMDFFGYMEGALRSGKRAAENLIVHLCAEPGKPVIPYPNPPGARAEVEEEWETSAASLLNETEGAQDEETEGQETESGEPERDDLRGWDEAAEDRADQRYYLTNDGQDLGEFKEETKRKVNP